MRYAAMHAGASFRVDISRGRPPATRRAANTRGRVADTQHAQCRAMPCRYAHECFMRGYYDVVCCAQCASAYVTPCHAAVQRYHARATRLRVPEEERRFTLFAHHATPCLRFRYAPRAAAARDAAFAARRYARHAMRPDASAPFAARHARVRNATTYVAAPRCRLASPLLLLPLLLRYADVVIADG